MPQQAQFGGMLRSGDGHMGGGHPDGKGSRLLERSDGGGQGVRDGPDGQWQQHAQLVECFDPATGTWEVVAPMGTARVGCCSVSAQGVFAKEGKRTVVVSS